ncbi:MAG: hypothetical protein WA885_19700 [Phormidesmis sp.]
MTPEAMQAAIEANTDAIAQINQALNTIVSEFIRPTAQQAVANFERLERIEAVVAANAEEITHLGRVVQANADQLADTRQLLAANAQQQAESKTEMNQLRAFHREVLQSMQVLINDTRADRQRIVALEQQAS